MLIRQVKRPEPSQVLGLLNLREKYFSMHCSGPQRRAVSGQGRVGRIVIDDQVVSVMESITDLKDASILPLHYGGGQGASLGGDAAESGALLGVAVAGQAG